MSVNSVDIQFRGESQELTRAIQRSQAELAKLNSEIAKTAGGYDRSSVAGVKAADQFAKSHDRMRSSLSQASYALDDFVNSLSAGGLGPAIRSTSNNFSTLATSINPVFGLLTTVGIAAIGFIVPRLLGLGAATKEAAKEGESYREILQGWAKDYDRLTKSSEQLEDQELKRQKSLALADIESKLGGVGFGLLDSKAKARREAKERAINEVESRFANIQFQREGQRQQKAESAAAEQFVQDNPQIKEQIKRQILRGDRKEKIEEDLFHQFPVGARGSLGTRQKLMREATVEAGKQDAEESKASFWQKKAVEVLEEKRQKEQSVGSREHLERREAIAGMRGDQKRRAQADLDQAELDLAKRMLDFGNSIDAAKAKLNAFLEEEAKDIPINRNGNF